MLKTMVPPQVRTIRAPKHPPEEEVQNARLGCSDLYFLALWAWFLDLLVYTD